MLPDEMNDPYIESYAQSPSNMSPLDYFLRWEKEQPNRIFLRQPLGGRWRTWTWAEAGQPPMPRHPAKMPDMQTSAVRAANAQPA
jgi:hypothetical protein